MSQIPLIDKRQLILKKLKERLQSKYGDHQDCTDIIDKELITLHDKNNISIHVYFKQSFLNSSVHSINSNLLDFYIFCH
jgi:hypothetical protein